MSKIKINYYAAKMLEKVWPRAYDLSTDGCSSAPDAWWKECCAEHDFYYRNDVGVTRAEADARLAQCMREKGAIVSSVVFYLVVRAVAGTYWHGTGDNAMDFLNDEDDEDDEGL